MLDLVVALLALSAYRLWGYPEHRPLFLILANANMMLCAGAAVAGAVVAWRRAYLANRELASATERDGQQHEHAEGRRPYRVIFSRMLAVTMIFLLVAELGAFILELRPPEVQPGSFLVWTICCRLGVAALAVRAALRPLPGTNDTVWTVPSALAMVVAAVWGLTLVAYPLWLDGHGADALVAACAVLALAMVAVALWRGGAGHPRQTPLRFFALAGLCLYLITDLSYMQHMARGDESFVVAEVGFYGGYLLVAWGALRDSKAVWKLGKDGK